MSSRKRVREPAEFEDCFAGISIQCNEAVTAGWSRVLGDSRKGHEAAAELEARLTKYFSQRNVSAKEEAGHIPMSLANVARVQSLPVHGR